MCGSSTRGALSQIGDAEVREDPAEGPPGAVTYQQEESNMAIKLIRVTSGPAKGKYLLRITESGDIIHPNGHRSKNGQLP
jgi:hypothetical protein